MDKNSMTVFKLKLLDINQEEFSIPPVELECVITIPSNIFQRLCRDMLSISETLTIESGDTLKISCEGDFASQETYIGEATHGLTFNKKSDKELVKGKFSLKHLNLFTKSTNNLSNTIEILMKNNYPLILKYNVANLGEIRYCLAPKTE
jgi:proliferating cell nuclear antigen